MFHILVVDDDKNTRLLLRSVLEPEGYTVSTAENGKQALALLDREYVDLVVLDVMMTRPSCCCGSRPCCGGPKSRRSGKSLWVT